MRMLVFSFILTGFFYFSNGQQIRYTKGKIECVILKETFYKDSVDKYIMKRLLYSNDLIDHEYVYDHIGNIVERSTFKYFHNNLIEKNIVGPDSSIQIYKYSYNDKGYLIKEEIFEQKEKIEFITYQYNSFDSIVKITSHKKSNGAFFLADADVYIYDKYNRLIQNFSLNSNGDTTNNLNLSYVKDTTISTIYDNNSSKIISKKIKYKLIDGVVFEKRIDRSLKVVSEKTSIYNRQGKLLRELTFKTYENSVKNLITLNECEYNTKGVLIKKLIKTEEEDTIDVSWFNEDGRILKRQIWNSGVLTFQFTYSWNKLQ